MLAILASEHFVALNTFALWGSRRLPIARACATSKPALDRSPQNCTVWGCADLWQNPHWPTRTNYVIGAYGPIWPPSFHGETFPVAITSPVTLLVTLPETLRWE